MRSKTVLESHAAILSAQAGCEYAQSKDWAITICVVDDGGHVLAVHRMENAAPGTVQAAIEKAQTAALFRAPTKLFQEFVANGQTSMLALPDAMPIQGGVPIQYGNEVIGAVGVSGVQSDQDEEIALKAIANLQP